MKTTDKPPREKPETPDIWTQEDELAIYQQGSSIMEYVEQVVTRHNRIVKELQDDLEAVVELVP